MEVFYREWRIPLTVRCMYASMGAKITESNIGFIVSSLHRLDMTVSLTESRRQDVPGTACMHESSVTMPQCGVGTPYISVPHVAAIMLGFRHSTPRVLPYKETALTSPTDLRPFTRIISGEVKCHLNGTTATAVRSRRRCRAMVQVLGPDGAQMLAEVFATILIHRVRFNATSAVCSQPQNERVKKSGYCKNKNKKINAAPK